MDKEKEIIISAQEGNESSKNILIKNYEPLIIRTIKTKDYFIEGGDIQDLIQEGRLALFNAIKTYDHEKNVKFSIYAKRVIENHIINVIKKFANNKNAPLNNAYNVNNQGELDLSDGETKVFMPIKPTQSIEEDYIGEQNAKILIDSIVKTLSPLENKILQLKLQDLSYTEIADKLEISSKKVDNALNRIKNKIINLK